MEASSNKPKEGESVKITARFTKPLNTKLYKIQWFVSNQKAEKSSRYVFSSPSDLESCFEVKPVKSVEEGALIEAALIKLKDNCEVARASLQFEKNLKLLSDLKASKGKYEPDEPVEFSCELSRKPENLRLFKNPKESREVLCVGFDPTKEDSHQIEVDDFTVHLVKSKDGSYKLRVVKKKPSFKEDNDIFWLDFNQSEITTNECRVEIKRAGLKFAGEISAAKADLVDSKDKLEIVFAVKGAGVAVDEVKHEVQAVLKRDNSKKEDTFLASSFEVCEMTSRPN